MDEAEFNKVVDPSDRTMIYQSVRDTDTRVRRADKSGLKAAMKDAADLMEKSENDATGLQQVFGSKYAATAKTNYEKGRKALINTSRLMGLRVSTDYNLDDDEVDLGGWANFRTKRMHLVADVVKVSNPNASKVTLVHEAMHLADLHVDDLGYYGSPGFESMSEIEKLDNSAHYEELPRRQMGTSEYVGVTFTPDASKTGAPVTREDHVRRDASEFMRRAWDAAVSVHTFLRDVHRAGLAGRKRPFRIHRALIEEISGLMDLTIHEQSEKRAEVTTLDLTLTESIARGISKIVDNVDEAPFPTIAKTSSSTRRPPPTAISSTTPLATARSSIGWSTATDRYCRNDNPRSPRFEGRTAGGARRFVRCHHHL